MTPVTRRRAPLSPGRQATSWCSRPRHERRSLLARPGPDRRLGIGERTGLRRRVRNDPPHRVDRRRRGEPEGAPLRPEPPRRNSSCRRRSDPCRSGLDVRSALEQRRPPRHPAMTAAARASVMPVTEPLPVGPSLARNGACAARRAQEGGAGATAALSRIVPAGDRDVAAGDQNRRQSLACSIAIAVAGWRVGALVVQLYRLRLLRR